MIDPILQYKYVALIGDKLDGFKRLRNGIYNFRCPICGDSEKKTVKKRGYLLEKEGMYFFYCHNCGTSLSLKNFIKNVNPDLYREMQKDMLTSKNRIKIDKKPAITAPKFVIKKHDDKLLIPVSELDDTHPAKIYLKGRNISDNSLPYVKWTDNFPELVQKTIGDKYKDTKLPMNGIIFQLRELDGTLTGYQIRSIDKDCPKSQRFIICSINDEHGFFYKELDLKKKIYIVEGCIDSLFIENSLAVLSASLYRIHPSENCIYINDQEPRNKEVSKQIKRCIDRGYPVVLLPQHEYEGMDINDLINSGIKQNDLLKLFDEHTFSGLSAKMQFSKWKK